MATIEEIAKKAKVSPSTVSRVFNNKGNIATETKEKVLNIADKLNYEPKRIRAKAANAKKVGVIFSKQINNISNNSFYGRVMEGVEQSLKEHNYEIFFKTLSDNIEEDLQTVKELKFDSKLMGLILCGCTINKDFIRKVKKSNIPLVLVDNHLWEENINCVVNDNFLGARRIVQHLLELGHRKIAFYGGPLVDLSFEERYMGYLYALKRYGVSSDEKLIIIRDNYSNKKNEEILNMLDNKDKRPTAVFCSNDATALELMKILKKHGYTIPEDISVAGFDDIEMSHLYTPSLTTVKTFKKEMGILAGKRLYELKKGITPKPVKMVVSVEPVFRKTTSSIERKNKS